MNDRTLNDILKNPIYNGCVTRKGERSPATWREAPTKVPRIGRPPYGTPSHGLRGPGRRSGPGGEVREGRCPIGSACRSRSWSTTSRMHVQGRRDDDRAARVDPGGGAVGARAPGTAGRV